MKVDLVEVGSIRDWRRDKQITTFRVFSPDDQRKTFQAKALEKHGFLSEASLE